MPGTRAICGQPARDVDHRLAQDDHRDEALWALCGPHHDAKTAAEAQAAKRRQPGRQRPREQHPGIT
jgi:5-methylcytosine-specific restriction protein A